jgi:predicted nucleic acid-binding protein
VIILDASVLVQYLRRPSGEVREVFELRECGVAGVTRAEILHGCRSEQDLLDTVKALDVFGPVATPEETWDSLGVNLRLLRMRGLAVPFTDALLSTIAISRGDELWGHDAHFAMIQTALPKLRLFSLPTK